ncbi:MAG: thioesterase [Betaproteobacteria bacterium HGW-Betaproteobacteria-4]|nr:MAG: thioesterase [Betaproteobacteria bacterium HGW-Betaproteobacteria-4]
MQAFQDYYPENLAHCYGCGRENAQGHQIKIVYGGLLASLIDCHGTGTAAAAMYRAENRSMDSLPPFRFVTGSLQVSYLKPTPLGPQLEIRGKVKEIKGRKVVVEATVYADGEATARGEVVALQMPDTFVAR